MPIVSKSEFTELFSRIMNATERSGTAASLFEKMTDNASANMQRIKNNITIIVAQLGQIFEPLINVAMVVTNVLATIANNTPGFIKTAVGGFLLLFFAFINKIFY